MDSGRWELIFREEVSPARRAGWKMIDKGVYWPVYSTQMMRKTPIMSML